MSEKNATTPSPVDKLYKILIAALCSLFCIIEVVNFIPLKFGGTVLLKSMPSTMFYAIHLSFGLCLIFLIYDLKGSAANWTGGKKLVDIVCAVAALIMGLYIVLDMEDYLLRINTTANTGDLVFAAITLVLVLEAARRMCGPTLPIFAGLMVAYGIFGRYLPGILRHKGYSWTRILSTIFSEPGVFGMPLGVSATTVFLFILFAAFLNVCGADTIFRDVSLILAGRQRGGPAKIAVIGSGLFGSISGSAVANVVGTGAFTIPLMKDQGYKPHFAGAVEAVSSTGGQIMPPVMGAAAFILADYTGMPYGAVCLMAAIPALLYYICLFVMVDIESIKNNMFGLDHSMIPNKKKVLGASVKLFVPIAALLVALIGLKKAPALCAIIAMGAVILCTVLDRKSRFTFQNLIQAFEQGAVGALQVISACACSGIVIGMLNMTGLGLKFSTFILALGGHSLMLCLIFAMIVSIILGMGLPTTAAYIITATSMGSSLVKLGLPIFHAHLFLFYFACISAITPPVAVASYAAAGIAKESPTKVGWEAVRLGIVGFLVPFGFTLNPDMLSLNFTHLPTLLNLICTCIAPFAMACVMQGYLHGPLPWFMRVAFFAACVALVSPWLLTNLLGGAFTLSMLCFYRTRAKKRGLSSTIAGDPSGQAVNAHEA